MISIIVNNLVEDIKYKIKKLQRNKKLEIQEIMSNDKVEIKIYKKKKIVYCDIAGNDNDLENLYERFNEFYLEYK
jgi:hypothetical protein